ncbi:MAG: PspA/IM30 family protein [Lachnospiraceae bacterium]|jgi:phage shock protein A|nr:PspA/IM30 family protein [Lachnospiraceae bacterium]
MSIFHRISDILKANINDLLDRAEDPEKMVKQIIADMEEQVRDATEALGQAMASEKQAYAQLEKARSNSREWENKAKTALQAGNQELAKKALTSKVEIDKNVQSLQASYDQIAAQTSELHARVEVLRQKLEEARQRQNMLIARAKMAEATESVATAVTNTDPNSALAKLERMEQKVESREARAEAFAAMSGETVFAKDEFAELETNQAVDAELQRLMKELNG